MLTFGCSCPQPRRLCHMTMASAPDLIPLANYLDSHRAAMIDRTESLGKESNEHSNGASNR
jgi:hypothetical protein